MSGEALGGGVMVAVAAVLWVAYLMPTWSRRRQFLATERNAVRLQQTLRILAETAEVPQQVRLEANARTVATQRKLLAQTQENARAVAKEEAEIEAAALRTAAAVEAAARRAAAASEAAAHPSDGAAPKAMLRRLRRGRAFMSLVLLTGLVSALGGLIPALAGGPWIVLGGGVIASLAALAALSRFARTAAQIRSRMLQRAPEARVSQAFEPVQFDEAPAVPQTWTPHPLPRPLHLSRGSIAQTAMASVEAAVEMRRAAAEAEIAARAARLAPEVTPISRPAAARAAQRPAASTDAPAEPVDARFASMGIVGETGPGMTDLDAVLRRRRAAG